MRFNNRMFQAILKLRGETQEDVAEKTGLHKNTISRIANGKNFSVETVGRIAKAIEVSEFDLLIPEEKPSPLVGAPTISIRA